ncbi:type IV fimbrial biogenesis protein FimT [Massilia sp. UYP11]|uniref:pilus assembly FimT family protein n=1 Tax=Massilia sp. UYP11 TaxID=1756385 RepID=UPI003D1C1E9D
MLPVRRSDQGGFTAIEAFVVLAILGILLAVGVPGMRGWLGGTTATGAAEFYAEGFRTARNQALANNSRSRLVFTENAGSGQLDWQVDVCFPMPDDGCAADSERWSTVDDPAPGPQDGNVATRSVFRSAAALPRTTALTVAPDAEARSVYFTELGWVDGGKPALMRLDLGPGSADAERAFTPGAVVLTLAGAVVTCRPDVGNADSRRCP